MTYDIIVRGGLIVDGSGRKPFTGDIGIQAGALAAIGGKLPEHGAREIDASGLVVTPGFIDAHTHYDAQIDWDPMLGSSGRHGITTVLMGNCGFTLAPCRSRDQDYLVRMLTRVEGMPVAALREGLAWNWDSFG